ncbi:hypothetical protein [Natrinema sp. CBA1119]|nr:hypothetical protein [Natrinema sp. CBA1119]
MSIRECLPVVETATAHWSKLERDWKSTIVAGTVVALVGMVEIKIPW